MKLCVVFVTFSKKQPILSGVFQLQVCVIITHLYHGERYILYSGLASDYFPSL